MEGEKATGRLTGKRQPGDKRRGGFVGMNKVETAAGYDLSQFLRTPHGGSKPSRHAETLIFRYTFQVQRMKPDIAPFPAPWARRSAQFDMMPPIPQMICQIQNMALNSTSFERRPQLQNSQRSGG
jgi:hypothetical protein